MKHRFFLLDIDKPMFGRVIFPQSAVELAIQAADKARSQFHNGALLEVCRYEEPWWKEHDEPDEERDEMIGKLNDSGRLLEVIGYVTSFDIVDKRLVAEAELQKDLTWRRPFDHHTPVPYMDFRTRSERDGMKLVEHFFFTEIVMVYQGVTRLALRKFAEKKNQFSC